MYKGFFMSGALLNVKNLSMILLLFNIKMTLFADIDNLDWQNALTNNNFKKFAQGNCYTLSDAESIKTCAMVKYFFAQALQEELKRDSREENRLPSLICFSTGGSLIGAYLGAKFASMIQLNGQTVGLAIGSLTGMTLSQFAWWQAFMRNRESKELETYRNYYQKLAEKPFVMDRTYMAEHPSEVYENNKIEKKFNEMVSSHDLQQKSPMFLWHRLTDDASISHDEQNT